MNKLLTRSLFSSLMLIPGFLFAQQSKEPAPSKKVHVVIQSDENGKETTLDTTFNSKEEADAFMKKSRPRGTKQHNGEEEEMLRMSPPAPPLPPPPPLPPGAPGTNDERKAMRIRIEKNGETEELNLGELQRELEKLNMDLAINGMPDRPMDFQFMTPGDSDEDQNVHVQVFTDGDESKKMEKKIIIIKDECAPAKTSSKRSKRKNESEQEKEIKIVRSYSLPPDMPGSIQAESFPKLEPASLSYQTKKAGSTSLQFSLSEKKPVTVVLRDNEGKSMNQERIDDFQGSYSKEISHGLEAGTRGIIEISQDGKKLRLPVTF